MCRANIAGIGRREGQATLNVKAAIISIQAGITERGEQYLLGTLWQKFGKGNPLCVLAAGATRQNILSGWPKYLPARETRANENCDRPDQDSRKLTESCDQFDVRELERNSASELQPEFWVVHISPDVWPIQPNSFVTIRYFRSFLPSLLPADGP